MKEYFVTWEIDIDATSPLEAARKALAYQRDPESTTTVFKVRNQETGEEVSVDLEKA